MGVVVPETQQRAELLDVELLKSHAHAVPKHEVEGGLLLVVALALVWLGAFASPALAAFEHPTPLMSS